MAQFDEKDERAYSNCIRLFGGQACDYTGVIESGDDTSGHHARLSLTGQRMVSGRIQ